MSWSAGAALDVRIALQQANRVALSRPQYGVWRRPAAKEGRKVELVGVRPPGGGRRRRQRSGHECLKNRPLTRSGGEGNQLRNKDHNRIIAGLPSEAELSPQCGKSNWKNDHIPFSGLDAETRNSLSMCLSEKTRIAPSEFTASLKKGELKRRPISGLLVIFFRGGRGPLEKKKH